MTNEFMREERYIVFKISDVVEHLTTTEALHLARLYEIQRVGRKGAGKPELECVVVESDWPEYEPTWRAIEARVTGAQNVPKAVAYLDLGAGGYMGIGTDLTDEALAALPRGRHMLGIVGTYGIDGYVPAQPAPSVPACADIMDAARYRWLRENGRANEKRESRAVLPRGGKKASMAFRYWTTPEELDMTIDAMISAAPEAKP